jgi:cation:H+ antiporter
VGVALVLWGADRLTEGASALARRMNVPEMVIGLTIVAAGTSCPELFVSVVSALNDTPDLAVGNVVGSNAMNTLLIVGVTAMVAPMAISRSTVSKDMPFTVGASLLLAVLCMDGFGTLSIAGHFISRLDGVILLAGFAIFMAYTFKAAQKGGVEASAAAVGADPSVCPPSSPERTALIDCPPPSVWKGIFFIVLGLACLVVGSKVFVSSATAVAAELGVSQSVIGLTIVAGGTSLPELATSVVAARKGQSAMAIGNVIGSNVFNILLILGLTAAICPMQIEGITLIDMAVMLISMVVLWLFSFTKLTVERWEGAVLTLGYAAYLAWLLYNV